MPEKSENRNVEKIDVNRPLVMSPLERGRYREDEDECKLLEFQGDNRYVVRVDTLEILRAQLGDENLTIEGASNKVKSLFDELREKYGIDAPVNFAIVDGENQAQLFYIITNKVDGKDIEKINFDVPNREDLMKETETFFLSLVKYFLDKFSSDGLVFWDIADKSAYKYGKKEGDTSDHFYLVDTDIKCGNGENGIMSLSNILPTIKEMESKCGKKFNSVRDALRKFIEPIIKNGGAGQHAKTKDMKRFADFLEG